MPLSKSLAVFDDVRDILNQALAMHGAVIVCASHTKAIQLRHRMNHYRVLDRNFNCEVYPPGHQMHGRSVFDKLIFSIERGSNRVVIAPRSVEKFTIEPLETNDAGSAQQDPGRIRQDPDPLC